ncbi:hypothetical protein D3C80_951880 [compost metagenome]
MDDQVEGVLFDEKGFMQRVAGLEAVVQRADIATGTEPLGAFAAQDHGAYVRVVGPLVQVLTQAAHHVQGQGIETGWAVQGQVADLVADLGQYMVGCCRGMSVCSHCVLPALLLIFQVKSGVRWRIAGSWHANLPCTIDNCARVPCVFTLCEVSARLWSSLCPHGISSPDSGEPAGGSSPIRCG